jgi:hypothetical protein
MYVAVAGKYPPLRKYLSEIHLWMESVSRRETGSLKPDIDVEQKTDIYAFALNDILKFILIFAGWIVVIAPKG